LTIARYSADEEKRLARPILQPRDGRYRGANPPEAVICSNRLICLVPAASIADSA
jgi:hypothetical protein